MRPIELIMNICSFLRLSPLGPYHSMMYGRSLYFDISKAESELGFTPKYDTDTMFSESYEKNNKIKVAGHDSAHKSQVSELVLKVFRLYKK